MKIIYVSINEGNDSWTGEEPDANTHGTGPVKTVERARDIAESTSYANEQIKIIIREGVYSFATPLVLESFNSGFTKELPTIYEAYQAGVNKDVDAGTKAVAVNSGTAVLSVIMEDGGVFMFGQNTTGQISRCECLQNIDPNITIETTDTGYGGDGYTYFKFSAGSNLKPVKIDTSDNHTAILLNNGKVYVWGTWQDNTITSPSTNCDIFYTIVNNYPNLKFKDISVTAGFGKFAALTEDNELIAFKIIDSTDTDKVEFLTWDGDPLTNDRITFYNDNSTNNDNSHTFKGRKFKKIELGEDDVIGILDNGKLWCSADLATMDTPFITTKYYADSIFNYYVENLSTTYKPDTYELIDDEFIDVTSTLFFRAGIKKGGIPYVWGNIGIDVTANTQYIPIQYIEDGTRAVAVDGGSNGVCWVMENGTVECFGEGVTQNMPVGIDINPSYQIEKISVGDENVIALSKSGKVYAWGKGGKLGEGLNGAVITTSQYVIDLNITETIDAYNDTQETVYEPENVQFTAASTLNPSSFTLLTSALDSTTYNKLHANAKGNVYVYDLGSSFDVGKFTTYWHGSWENQSDQLTNTCSEYILPYALYQTNPYCHKGSDLPPIPEISVDDEPYNLARWPSAGYAEVTEVVEAGSSTSDKCDCITADCTGKVACYETTTDCNYKTYPSTTFMNGKYPSVKWGTDGIFRYSSVYDSIISKWPNPSTNEMFVVMGTRYDWACEGFKILDINKTDRTIKINSHASNYGLVQFNEACYSRGYLTSQTTTCTCKNVFGTETIPLPTQLSVDTSTCAVQTSYRESNDALLTRKWSTTNQPWRQDYWANPHPRRWYLLNVLEELNSPGQYYIDRTNKKLYIWPIEPLTSNSKIHVSKTINYGSDNKATNFERERLNAIVKMVGARNITFRNINFSDTSGNGIDVIDCKDVKIENCEVYNIRKRGIRVMGGSNVTIDNCFIHDTGKDGAFVAGGDKIKLEECNHIVKNSTFTKTNKVMLWMSSSSALKLHGVGITVRKNKFYDLLAGAIHFFGNNITIEYNNIKDAIQECDDCGAIYTWSNISNRGNIIRYNLFRDIKTQLRASPKFPSANVGSCTTRTNKDPNNEVNASANGWHGTSAIYLDNHASGLTVYGNIFYKCSNSMGKNTMGVIFTNYGIDVVASNNIFIECEIPFGSNENALYYDSWTQAQIDTAQITQWEKTINDKPDPWGSTGYSEVGNFLGWGVMMNWNGTTLGDPNSTTFVQYPRIWEANHKEWGALNNCDIRSTVYQTQYPELFGIKQDVNPKSFLYFDSATQLLKVNINYKRKNYANNNIHIKPGRLPNNSPRLTNTYTVWNQRNNNWVTTNDTIINEVDDAGFVDTINGNFSLKSSSPIKTVSNFDQIPVHLIAGFQQENIEDVSVTPDLTSLPIYYDRQDAQNSTWGSSVGDGSTITAESKYLKNNPNTRKYIMVYQKYFESSGAVIPNSGDPDIMIANFKKADLTKTMEQAVIRAAQEYNNYIDLINNDTVNGSKTPVEHMGETPLIVFDFETPIYSSILGWWIADPVTNAEKWGAGTWQFTVDFAKGMIPKAKELIANASFRAQNNIPDIFLNAKFAHYSVPYAPQDSINGKSLQLASDDERFNRRKLLLSDTRLGQIIPTQDFFTVQVYSYYPMSNGGVLNPADCEGALVAKNLYNRDWNEQQLFDSIEICMDWMRKTGVEKDIYPLISTSYLGGELPNIYGNCNNLLFDVSDLSKDFWNGRQITKDDFLKTMQICYSSGKNRIKGFLIWSGYNYFITTKIKSCNINDRYHARSVYARDIDDTLLTKIQDDDYWPDVSSCVPNVSGEIISASIDNSNFIKLVIYCIPGYSLEIYRKTTETGSSFQKIATKIIENDITTYYDIDSTLSALKTYVYKTVVSGSSSPEVTGRIVNLSSASSSTDYSLWANEFYGDVPLSSTIFSTRKGIVPIQNPRIIGTNGQRNPETLNYPVKESDWNTFKNNLNSIPKGRRIVGLSAWWRDISYFRDVTVDYYAATTDGTTYDGKRFPTLWSNKNAEDGQSSFTAFLQRCKDEGVEFDYLLDDKEFEYIWHIDYAGAYLPNDDGTGRLRDSRLFKAITSDSRFTTLKNPITQKTFAEEFIFRFNELTGRNLVTSDWYVLLEPYIAAGCKPGETIPKCFKYPSTYWTQYGCAPATGNSQTGSPDSCYLQTEKTSGRLRSDWPSGISDGAGLTAYSLATDVVLAWNAVADNWHFNVYMNKQFVEALEKFPEFNNVKYMHYEAEPVSAQDAKFYQDSNDIGRYKPNTNNRTITGPSVYNDAYGVKNILWPYASGYSCNQTSFPSVNFTEPKLAADTPFYGPNGNCSSLIKMPIEFWYRNIYATRSGYAINPKNDLEKYRWIPHLLTPYGGASGEAGIQRYPVTDLVRIAEFKATLSGTNMTVTQLISGTIIPKMQLHASSGLNKNPSTQTLEIVSGSGNNWVVSYGSQNVTSPLTIKGYYWKEDNTLLGKMKAELCYKSIVDEIKEIRHSLRSDINYYKNFAPWLTRGFGQYFVNSGDPTLTSQAYWFEQTYHIILSGARHFNLFNGTTNNTQEVLDNWRILSDNKLVIPCSNSTGDISQIVDRITFPDVFTKYLISGGKLEGTDIYIWRITIPPEKFYSTGKVKLTRVGTDIDIPESIIIDNTNTKSRGIWIKRNISTPPEYTVSAG